MMFLTPNQPDVIVRGDLMGSPVLGDFLQVTKFINKPSARFYFVPRALPNIVQPDGIIIEAPDDGHSFSIDTLPGGKLLVKVTNTGNQDIVIVHNDIPGGATTLAPGGEKSLSPRPFHIGWKVYDTTIGEDLRVRVILEPLPSEFAVIVKASLAPMSAEVKTLGLGDFFRILREMFQEWKNGTKNDLR
jgi:hypothetical protein